MCLLAANCRVAPSAVGVVEGQFAKEQRNQGKAEQAAHRAANTLNGGGGRRASNAGGLATRFAF